MDREALITSNASGTLFAAWTSLDPFAPTYRVRPAADSAWSPVVRIDDHLYAASVDRNGDLHLLVNAQSPEGGGLHYLTNATGEWTRTNLPGCTSTFPNDCDRAVMAYDPVTDRLIVVERHYESRHGVRIGVVRIGGKPANAPAFGPLHPLPATESARYRLVPSSSRPTAAGSRSH